MLMAVCDALVPCREEAEVAKEEAVADVIGVD
jgi:hypothetical protein